ncbi:NAD(P)/FAD-dependent oxidoreductase [Chelativorans sp. M5D2P16]|uniref:NAD(P)/FAD-dependent oxidoreductase n=1 Tax=Chelativorans sp. M5D2P16 TaxID=3095678 RepID=UPI002ACA4866|nr:FAD-dependent oxidoreductase [Chelativorans sp. M5D2P16]MDZ5700098.1 FAD-dependent oxidoreductase [Chelativorans sp. M5D2P16]
MTEKRIVIVGAGQAGLETATALRQRGFEGQVTIVGEEEHEPYQRPPLSKDFLKSGGSTTTGVFLRAPSFFTEKRIDLRLGARAERIDREEHRLILRGGEALSYDHLVLATGATNRRLPVPGLDHPDVLELRGLDHARRLLDRLPRFGHVCIIGGGFIGLEIASFLREKDVAVTVVEATARLMGRVVSKQMSRFFRDFHERSGVAFRFEAPVTEVAHGAQGSTVRLTDGGVIEADAVLLAAGVVPDDALARAAGLAVDDGIVVDELLLTSDPAISAIGDCAAHPSRFATGRVRLESVQNALDQAKCVAARLTGAPHPYDSVPWFWSTQGTARLQIAGLATDADDDILRGDPASGRFSVYRYKCEVLRAVETVNNPGEHMLARRLIAAGVPVAREQVRDPDFDLKRLLPKEA